MAQFDVYVNQSSHSKAHYPYLVDIQSAVLTDLVTRIVIPFQGTRTKLRIRCNTPVSRNQVCQEGLIVGVLMTEPDLAWQTKV